MRKNKHLSRSLDNINSNNYLYLKQSTKDKQTSQIPTNITISPISFHNPTSKNDNLTKTHRQLFFIDKNFTIPASNFLEEMYRKYSKNLLKYLISNRTGLKLAGNKYIQNLTIEEYMRQCNITQEQFLNLFKNNPDSNLLLQTKNNTMNIKINNEDMFLTPLPNKSRQLLNTNKEKNDFLQAERAAVLMRTFEYTHGLRSKVGMIEYNKLIEKQKQNIINLLVNATLKIQKWWKKNKYKKLKKRVMNNEFDQRLKYYQNVLNDKKAKLFKDKFSKYIKGLIRKNKKRFMNKIKNKAKCSLKKFYTIFDWIRNIKYCKGSKFQILNNGNKKNNNLRKVHKNKKKCFIIKKSYISNGDNNSNVKKYQIKKIIFLQKIIRNYLQMKKEENIYNNKCKQFTYINPNKLSFLYNQKNISANKKLFNTNSKIKKHTSPTKMISRNYKILGNLSFKQITNKYKKINYRSKEESLFQKKTNNSSTIKSISSNKSKPEHKSLKKKKNKIPTVAKTKNLKKLNNKLQFINDSSTKIRNNNISSNKCNNELIFMDSLEITNNDNKIINNKRIISSYNYKNEKSLPPNININYDNYRADSTIEFRDQRNQKSIVSFALLDNSNSRLINNNENNDYSPKLIGKILCNYIHKPSIEINYINKIRIRYFDRIKKNNTELNNSMVYCYKKNYVKKENFEKNENSEIFSYYCKINNSSRDNDYFLLRICLGYKLLRKVFCNQYQIIFIHKIKQIQKQRKQKIKSKTLKLNKSDTKIHLYLLNFKTKLPILINKIIIKKYRILFYHKFLNFCLSLHKEVDDLIKIEDGYVLELVREGYVKGYFKILYNILKERFGYDFTNHGLLFEDFVFGLLSLQKRE